MSVEVRVCSPIAESVSTNTVTSKRAGPPPVSKKPPSVKQDSSRRSSYSRPDSRELLSSKDIKTKETKHLDRDSRSEDENLADTDEGNCSWALL